MNRTISLVKKNYIFLIVIIFLFLFYLPRFFLTCPLFSSSSFDAQAVFTWYYSSVKGLLPYRDVFYPYGILAYYKDTFILPHIVYQAIIPVTFSITFLLFQKVWKNNFFSILSFLFFFIFVNYFNAEAFPVYGLVTLMGTFFAFLFAKKKINKKIVFLVGTGCGVLFSILHPQGFYLIAIFILGLSLTHYLHSGFNLKTLLKIAHQLFIFILSIVIGFLPFVFFLLNKAILPDFINFFIHLSDLTKYGKSPFIPFSTTPPNLFTFSILITTAFYITYIIFLKNKKIELLDFFLFQLFLVLTLFENISIIRSLDSLITFVPLLILIIFCSKVYSKKSISLQIFLLGYLFIFLIIFFGIHLSPIGSFSRYVYSQSLSSCLEKNKTALIYSNDFKSIVKKINDKKLTPFFSFPADPSLYIFLNQAPPYYSNNYDSSPLYAQKKQIKYIEDNNVQYVIYNLKIPAIQDEVPNYIRTNKEMKYILNNFSIVDRINNFIILKLNDSPKDFFNNKFSEALSEFRQSLLDIDLFSIPKSEGIYKAQYISSKDLLKNKKVLSTDKLILVKAQKYFTNKKSLEMTIMVRDGKKSRVRFNKCDVGTWCIINLSNIPLFYFPKVIESIKINEDFKGVIELLNVQKENPFW